MPHELISNICTSTLVRNEYHIIFFLSHFYLLFTNISSSIPNRPRKIPLKKEKENKDEFHNIQSPCKHSSTYFRIALQLWKNPNSNISVLGAVFSKNKKKKKENICRNGWKCSKWFKLKSECEQTFTRFIVRMFSFFCFLHFFSSTE